MFLECRRNFQNSWATIYFPSSEDSCHNYQPTYLPAIACVPTVCLSKLQYIHIHCWHSSGMTPHFAIVCWNAPKIISNQNWKLKLFRNTSKRKVSCSNYLLNIEIQRCLTYTTNHPPFQSAFPLSCSPFPTPVVAGLKTDPSTHSRIRLHWLLVGGDDRDV